MLFTSLENITILAQSGSEAGSIACVAVVCLGIPVLSAIWVYALRKNIQRRREVKHQRGVQAHLDAMRQFKRESE